MTAPKKQKIGLVIGSGGLKALGMIPLFELLNEHHLIPDLLIGCSGGAILSSEWAYGASIPELHNLVLQYKDFVKKISNIGSIDFQTLLHFNNYFETEGNPPSAILNDSVFLCFKEQFKNKRLEDTKIKTLLLATDLKTGNPVFMNEGLLAECVYASCALFPVLPPICIKKQWLVDGAYYSAIPILEASKQGCDKIIAISFEEKPSAEHKNFFEFYMAFISQLLITNSKKQNSFAVHFHHGEILFINFYYGKNINFWDIQELDYINEVNSAIIEKNKEAIINHFNPPSVTS